MNSSNFSFLPSNTMVLVKAGFNIADAAGFSWDAIPVNGLTVCLMKCYDPSMFICDSQLI